MDETVLVAKTLVLKHWAAPPPAPLGRECSSQILKIRLREKKSSKVVSSPKDRLRGKRLVGVNSQRGNLEKAAHFRTHQ